MDSTLILCDNYLDLYIWFVKDTDFVIGGVSRGDRKLLCGIGGAVYIEGADADGDRQDSEGQLGT